MTVARDVRLRLQILKCNIDVAGPLRLLGDRFLLRCFFVRHSAALAEAAIIQSEEVDARSGKLVRQTVPALAIAIALVQQEYAGAGLAGREVRRLELGAIRRGQINNLLFRSRERNGRSQKQTWKYAARQSSAHVDLLS
jgi:hypothetical protein